MTCEVVNNNPYSGSRGDACLLPSGHGGSHQFIPTLPTHGALVAKAVGALIDAKLNAGPLSAEQAQELLAEALDIALTGAIYAR